MEKTIFCDSSSLISVAEACMLDVFEFFYKKGVNFFITDLIEEEIIKKPLSMEMKGYQLSALRLKKLIEKEVITVIKTEKKATDELLNILNNIFFADGKPIKLIDAGEVNLILAAEELNVYSLLIDERTTRLLIEAPFKISEHLEDEIGLNININQKNLREASRILSKFHVIRSTELITAAYLDGFFSKYEDQLSFFEASLYRLRYNGCAISFDEIKELIDIVRKNE